MPKKIIYSDLFFISIDEIHNFISTDSENRARNFIEKLLNKIKKLEFFPYIGVKIEENKYILVIDKNYLVKYRIEKETIYILTIKNIKLK